MAQGVIVGSWLYRVMTPAMTTVHRPGWARDLGRGATEQRGDEADEDRPVGASDRTGTGGDTERER